MFAIYKRKYVVIYLRIKYNEKHLPVPYQPTVLEKKIFFLIEKSNLFEFSKNHFSHS